MSDILQHEYFSFSFLQQLRDKVKDLKLDINFEEDINILLNPFQINGLTLRNRLIVQPMEGCDGKTNGEPDELTFRRYRRFASGGASIIWFEACAVVPEGRANPRQIWITKNSLPKFKQLVEETRKASELFDKLHRTYFILQLTHSGRYSKPEGKPKPIIAHYSKILDPISHVSSNSPLITDEELKTLEDKYVEAASLAEEAGFDGVDIKSCHRYLLSELLASHTRENSIYGGSFENRSRFLRNVATKIKNSCKSIFVSTRINAYDAIEYPYGFGMNKSDLNPDLTEIKDIVKFFKSIGSPFINITIGNPYSNPHVGRPYDLPTVGSKIPNENPLFGVSRFFKIVKEIQLDNPSFAIIGGGYTWLRNYFPYAAASNIKNKFVSLVGLGRMSFAYPDFITDLQKSGSIDPTRVCVSCSACTQIMRDGGKTGCVPRDGEIYGDIYKEGRLNSPEEIIKMAQQCRDCLNPTCQTLCPASVNIPGFVTKIANGDFEAAYQIIIRNNPFPEVCGYVCPSEELCEKGCINQFYSKTVGIRHLQKFVSEKARQNNWKTDRDLNEIKRNNIKVAVIGAGPSGLACSKTLINFGYDVTIFDKNNYFGGIPLDLIPKERISDFALQSEIKYKINESDQLKFRGNTVLSKDFTFEDIFNEGFKAIYIAIGLSGNVKLPKSNNPKSGVESAFSFLKRIKKGDDKFVPESVAVLGGGNTALDAAVTAKKAGAINIHLIYRRSFNEMPAWMKERELAMQLGINFLILTQPLDYISNDNEKLIGIKVARTKLLNEIDKSGRRISSIVPNSEHIIDTDLAIEALGQTIDEIVLDALKDVELTPNKLVKVDKDSHSTSKTGIFAGGDIINGGDTVVRAIADGVKAANEMNDFLLK